MVQEAGHGPRRGERLRRTRQRGQAGHRGVDSVRVLIHKLPEPVLVAAIQAAEMESILTEITRSQNCVHTYALRERAGRGVIHLARARDRGHGWSPDPPLPDPPPQVGREYTGERKGQDVIRPLPLRERVGRGVIHLARARDRGHRWSPDPLSPTLPRKWGGSTHVDEKVKTSFTLSPCGRGQGEG